ncbi:nucleoside 5-triphosphatase RdgB [Dehalogenimonas sp. WBC-2]|nr:nucleoside 5-triphosphatase RdgB [Dehalogenimonas sp. WBC-2]
MTSGISAYFHLPFCRRRCHYCSFYSTAGRESQIPAYVDAVIKEVELTCRTDSVLETIYFGGGTPSLFASSEIEKMISAVSKCYFISDNAEITLEANPGTFDKEYLRLLHRTGVNRLSLGIQSLDDAELRLLGRNHSASDALRSITYAKNAGFQNISLDFIYGVPYRALDRWNRMLDVIIGLGTEHLSLYGLTVEDGTSLDNAIKTGKVPAPDPDMAAAEYELAVKKLAASGYRQYEISNWARPGAESRHNLAYWQRKEYIGLGAAAHSFIDGQRLANPDNLDEYMTALNQGKLPNQSIETIDQNLALSETLFLGLRLCDGVSLDDIGRKFGIDLQNRFVQEIAELSALQLIKVEDRYLKLTDSGRLLSNEVFIRFLPS